MGQSVSVLLDELAPQLVTVQAKIREEHATTAPLFDCVSLFSPGEPAISRLIAYFLSPDEDHGQGTVFLEGFLNLLGISILLKIAEQLDSSLRLPRAG
jgi:hypothetical protein